MDTSLNRRALLRSGVIGAGALAFGPAFWRTQLAVAATPAQPAVGPYGPLGPIDANGLRLPNGFRSRRIAQANMPVPGTNYVLPVFPDGQAIFPTDDGGFALVTNSEAPDDAPGQGGASAIRFDRDGRTTSAYRILGGTSNNCAGGATPWGTWMSCEETDGGLVHECDPLGRRPAVAHPAMGAFPHEAICVDQAGRRIYESEDNGSGGFYRFTPKSWPDCSQGLLEIAIVGAGGVVRWVEVPDPSAGSKPTRQQVPGSTKFRRGEGIWFDSGIVYLATTSDNTVWAYNTGTETIEKVYDGTALKDPPFTNVDNITLNRAGEIFCCEDPGTLGMGVITPEGEVARFMEVRGQGQFIPGQVGEDVQNELTGPIFDATGTRMFVCAQRSFGFGVIYEITGPFRTERPPDRSAPQVRLDVPDRYPLRDFARGGLPVSVRLGKPADVKIVVRTSLTPKGSRKRRRVAIGRATVSRSFGPVAPRPKPTTTLRRELLRRRRGLRTQVQVLVTDAAGNRTALERRVLLTRPGA